MSAAVSQVGAPAPQTRAHARPQRSTWIDRLHQLTWRLRLGAVGFGLLAGALVALVTLGLCPDLDWDGYIVPYRIQAIDYGAVLLLSLPSAVGLGAHLVVPCDLTRALGWGTPDWGPSPCGSLSPTTAGSFVYSRIHFGTCEPVRDFGTPP